MAVYFITARDMGRVKIGYSADPERRRCKISSDIFCDVSLEAIIDGAREEEAALHARFAQHRERGEWFRLCDEIESFISAHSYEAFCEQKALRQREALLKPVITVSDLYRAWPGRSAELARDIGENINTVRAWSVRNSIPARAFHRIAREATRKGVEGVDLAFLAERAAHDWRAPADASEAAS